MSRLLSTLTKVSEARPASKTSISTFSIGDVISERLLVEKDGGESRFDLLAGPADPFGAGPRGYFGRQTLQDKRSPVGHFKLSSVV